MLRGQMTYNANNKDWNYTENKNLTPEICNAIYKIQSRSGYYRAKAGNLVCPMSHINDLSKIIKWVENQAHS